MQIGDITEFGEVSFISWSKCFVQFCDLGGKGVYGVYSMTFEEIENAKYNKEIMEQAPIKPRLGEKPIWST